MPLASLSHVKVIIAMDGCLYAQWKCVKNTDTQIRWITVISCLDDSVSCCFSLVLSRGWSDSAFHVPLGGVMWGVAACPVLPRTSKRMSQSVGKRACILSQYYVEMVQFWKYTNVPRSLPRAHISPPAALEAAQPHSLVHGAVRAINDRCVFRTEMRHFFRDWPPVL